MNKKNSEYIETSNSKGDEENVNTQDSPSSDFVKTLRNFFSHWKGMLITLIIAMTAGVVYCTAIKKQVWQSSGKVTISWKNQEDEKSLTQEDFNHSITLAKTFKNDIIKSDYVFEHLVNTLKDESRPRWKDQKIGVKPQWKNKYSVVDLRKIISFENPQDTPTIIVTAKTTDFDFSKYLVNNILLYSKEYCSEGVYEDTFSNSVRIAEFASYPSNVSSSIKKELVKFCVVGVILAAGYSIILEIYNHDIRSVTEYEKLTNTKVLAQIPSYTEKNKGDRNGKNK